MDCVFTAHIKTQLPLVVLAHRDPRVLFVDLLEVDNVVACRAITVHVKFKFIATQTCEI